ncbi:MAG: aldehyde dehydrogenase [Microbacteriaceae bacterium]|nr:aldehyde dehydrogenase [Microbacteriaceae bacterium]
MIRPDETTRAELDRIMDAAAASAPELAAMPPRTRSAGLLAVATALEQSRPELVQLAVRETGLAESRLDGELKRTIVQLKLFADVVIAGEYLDARIDEADPEFVLGPRPDLRRMLIPVGPVANFAASNFPFAFSVAGGDTASALAAGCPVIVKAHPGHPMLSALTADLVKQALRSSSFPTDSFAIVFGQVTGVELLRDDRLRAAAFTGSVRAGRTLADIAAQRPMPIPFYGELGSVNPVFVTRDAIDADRSRLAEAFIVSISGSAGQLCTKPGFLFAPADTGFEAELRLHAEKRPRERMLYPGLGHGYAHRRHEILATPGVTVIAEGSVTVDEDDQVWAAPTIVSVTADVLRSYRGRLTDEAFGPLSILVGYDSGEDLAALSRELFSGNLTGTIHLGPSEDPLRVHGLAAQLSTSTGRVIFGGWPTGVAVTPAMQHGGPYPATTNDSSTSVGTASISRFLRPVAYQDAPQKLLPEPLQDANPWSVPQKVARRGESSQWGKRFGGEQ